MSRVGSDPGNLDTPTFANMVEGGKTPYLPADELDEIGFDIVVFPLSALFAATEAIQQTYDRLHETGTTDPNAGVSFEDFETVIDAEAFRDRERTYADDE